MFIDYAELQAESHKLMSMQDWIEKTDSFLAFTEQKILKDAGRVSHGDAIAKAEVAFEIFRVQQDKEYISEFDKAMKKYLKGK
jgi:hypothetical protein